MRSTKLNRPKLSIELLQRPHLIEKLEKSKHLPLILISTPAGYGKSILVSQWLEEQKDNYSWLSLDEGMSNSSLFLTYFAEALERCSSVESPKLKKLDQEYHFLSWETIIDLIINRINKLKEPTRLILDDYQLIKNPEIHQLIETIITENISNFQFVIITRWNPPFQLNELRLYQKMLELKMQDLRFDENEITELLTVQHIISVKQEEIKELFERTEGWILAIRMVLLAKSFPEAVSGKKESEFLTNDLDYLMDHISDNLAPEFIRNVQLISLCDQFNLDLINMIFNDISDNPIKPDIFLDKLLDLNLFLIPTIHEGTWYRFHHLFGDILRRRLEKREPNIIKPLYISISEWFSRKGLIDEAIQYAIRAENFELACDLISEHRTNILDQGQWWIVQRWLNNIPRQFRKD